MSSPEKIDAVLISYLSDRGYLSLFKEYSVIYHWKEIVGEEIASISNCDVVENGILYVTVKSSVWRQEISFLKKDILQKIKTFVQCNSIYDIVFL